VSGSTDVIERIDEFLAARFPSFFTLAEVVFHTEVDELELIPFLDHFEKVTVVVKEEKLKCDCDNFFSISPVGRGHCDVCNRTLTRQTNQTVRGYIVNKPPASPYLGKSKGKIISGQILKELESALISCFNTHRFNRFMRHELNYDVDTLVSSNAGMQQRVYEVIDEFTKMNRLKELVQLAAAEFPNNAELQRLTSKIF
jgi:Effector-associated domain 1